MINLYKNIRELRKQNHWSQEELAKRMGYTDRSMIAKIEAGKVDLARSKIIDFAKVFNVAPGDLMDEEEWKNYTPSTNLSSFNISKYPFIHDPEFMGYVKKMWNFPRKNLEFIYKQIDFQEEWIEDEKKKKDALDA